jgi:hypothetical protein
MSEGHWLSSRVVVNHTSSPARESMIYAILLIQVDMSNELGPNVENASPILLKIPPSGLSQESSLSLPWTINNEEEN